MKRNNITKAFIVKPEASCQGRGIFITQDIYGTYYYITGRNTRKLALCGSEIYFKSSSL
jgi:predicted ATP-grasp superfamily ATP-dependent carboligase